MRSHNRFLFAALAATVLAGCWSIIQRPTIPGLADSLGARWVEVPLPDSRLTPGAIVEVTPVGANQVDLRWIGSLQRSCDIPPGVLDIQESKDGPKLQTGTSYSLGGDVSATLKKWGVTAEGKLGSEAAVKVNKSQVVGLDLVRFRSWYAQPANAQLLKTKCASLNDKNTYVVQEAFIISDGSYTVKDSAGLKVEAQGPTTPPVKVGIGASGKNDGELTIATPLVFALHRIQNTSDGSWVTLGQSGQGDALSPLAGKRIRNISN